MIHGILPAAGNAMRLRKLPKFLLPINESAETLIERHIENLSEIAQLIWFPIKPELIPLVSELKLGDILVPLPMKTATMSETILATCSLSSSDLFAMGMPDTAYTKEHPYKEISENIDLEVVVWRTRESQRGKVGAVVTDINDNNVIIDVQDKNPESIGLYHWGALKFRRSFLTYISPEMPHPGYAIMPAIKNGLSVRIKYCNGDYYDCGTFREYQEFLIQCGGNN